MFLRNRVRSCINRFAMGVLELPSRTRRKEFQFTIKASFIVLLIVSFALILVFRVLLSEEALANPKVALQCDSGQLPLAEEHSGRYYHAVASRSQDEEHEWTAVPTDVDLKDYGYKGQQLAAAGLLGAKPFLFTDYPFEFFIFNAFRHDIRQEFIFQDNIMEKAKARLHQILASAKNHTRTPSLTTVGVHVRLTDYPGHMRGVFSVADITESYAGYLRRAAFYFQERHPRVVFVVTSDDLKMTLDIFEEFHLKNVFVSQGSPEEDMCLLTLCDHNIITFGSFGFWTGYLGRGTTVYPELNITGLKYPHSRPFYEAARLAKFVPLIFRATASGARFVNH